MVSLATSTSSKKIKKSPSSSSFSRICSSEDEIIMLEAVVEIQEAEKQVPRIAAAIIYDDIQRKLSAQITVTQLERKLRMLRDKYSKELNETWNPHQKKLFLLCNHIWGIKNKIQGTKKNPVRQLKDDEIRNMEKLKDDDMRMRKELKGDDVDFVKNYPYLMEEVSKGSTSLVVKDILRYLDGSVLQRLNDRWRKQQMKECQIYLKRVELTKKHLQLVLNAHASTSKAKKDGDDELVGDDNGNEDAEDVDEKKEQTDEE